MLPLTFLSGNLLASRYMRNVDARYLKSQWQKARQAVQEELDAIKEIQTVSPSAVLRCPAQ